LLLYLPIINKTIKIMPNNVKTNEIEYVYEPDVNCGRCGLNQEINPDNGLCKDCNDEELDTIKDQ
jgi:hypothetical protein